MSHITTVRTEFRKPQRIKRVCDRLGIPCKLASIGQRISERVYSGDIQGTASIQLPGWQHPVVIDETGVARYDNYGGRWGKQQEFDKFAQEYAKTTVVEEFSEQGFVVEQEAVLADGTLQLQLTN